MLSNQVSYKLFDVSRETTWITEIINEQYNKIESIIYIINKPLTHWISSNFMFQILMELIEGYTIMQAYCTNVINYVSKISFL